MTDVANADETLIRLHYDELRRLAATLFRNERRDHTLQPTALVHMAYPQLVKASQSGFQNRAHFFGIARRVMKHSLIDYSRAHDSGKRLHQKLPLDEAKLATYQASDDILAVREAVQALATANPLWAAIVKLRGLDGLSEEEAAEGLGMGRSTLRREWSCARKWLRDYLEGGDLNNLANKKLTHYEVLDQIAQGSQTTVYKARDKRSGEFVALKALSPRLSQDHEFKTRFVREARCGSVLNHPNIVRVLENSSDYGIDFIVMEYIDGQRLDEVIPNDGLPLEVCLDYTRQIASALAFAHSLGIIHRDLKPSNILVTAGNLKLVDFGLAKPTTLESLVRSGDSDGVRTQPGTIMGTVGYMSPEQAQGHPIDMRSDIFSLGAILYEMLTGRRAFKTGSPIDTMYAIVHASPQALPETIPADVAHIVHRCLRKRPERRYQTVTALLGDLKSRALAK